MPGHRLTIRGLVAGLACGIGQLGLAGQTAIFPVPSPAMQRASMQRIREVFAGDFSKAKTSKEQAALAAELISHSRETQDVSDAYALLEAARTLAIMAGDATIGTRVIAELERRYRIDGEALNVKMLEELATRATGPTLGPVVDGLLAAAVKTAGRGDPASAEDLLKTAAVAARKARDKQRQDAVLGELKRIREQVKAAEKLAPLVERLESNPNDSAAATLLGKHRCFTEGDWEEGLPLLARGDDAALARLAAAELRPTRNATALGDAWWAYADSLKAPERSQAAARAVGHYRSSLEGLTGLEKIRIEKRIADAEQELANMPNAANATRPAGTVFWLDATAAGAVLNLEGKPVKRQAVAGEVMGRWQDTQVRSLTAIPTEPSTAPLFVPGAINGNPAIEFRGKQMLLAKGPLPEVGVLMLVAQPAEPVTAGCLLGSAGSPLMLDAWTRTDGAIWFTLFPRKGELNRFNTPPNTFETGKPFLLTVSWPRPFVLRVNAQPKVTANNAPAEVLGADGFVIGANDPKLRYPFSGFIGELLVFDRTFSADELLRLETALMQKWRIQP
jgi:hypothetical protein